MSKEVAVAKCRCGNYVPVTKNGYFCANQIFCTHCGRISSVRSQDIRWEKENRAAVALAVLGNSPKAYMTREMAEK